ncbi:MAG: glycosyltransferase family 4 protein [Prevotella sp.]|nr:glycosyltransferase family 4 protein [Prevotella sp.]
MSNKTWGGGEQFVLNLSRAFRNEGHRIIIYCRNSEVVAPRFSDFLPDVYPLQLRGYIDLRSPFILAQQLNTSGPVIIHTHNFKDAWTAITTRSISRNPNVRVMMTRHLVRPAGSSLFLKHILSKLDALVFVSNCACRAFMSSNPPIDSKKISVIYNGVQGPDTPPQRDYTDKLNLLFHGRITHEKGVDTLIRALAETGNTDLSLTIAGSGDSEYLNTLKNHVSSLKVANQVQWAGFQSDMSPLLSKAHLGIIPSRVAEACPLAAAECLAWGVPVVGSDVGAIKELVSPDLSGKLVNPDDPTALAATLRSVVSNREKLKEMAGNARKEYTERFTFSQMFETYRSLYSNLIKPIL